MRHLTTEDYYDLRKHLDSSDDFGSEYVALVDRLFGEDKLEITCYEPEKVELCHTFKGAIVESTWELSVSPENLDLYKPKNILKGIEEYEENRKEKHKTKEDSPWAKWTM